MRKIILKLLLITVTHSSILGQDIYTEVGLDGPAFSLITIENYLYTGLYSGGNIIRYDLNNPTPTPEIVSEGFTVFTPYYFGHDSLENDLYVSIIPPDALLKISLLDPLPNNSEAINVPKPTLYRGLDIDQNIIFLADSNNGSILKMDITQGVSSLETLYEDSSIYISFPRLYNNELYFVGVENGVLNLYKINPNLGNPIEELILPNISASAIEGAHLVENYLYVGSNSGKLSKINLNESPLQIEIIFEDIGGDIIGISNYGNVIYISTGGNNTIWHFVDEDLSTIDRSKNSFIISPNPTSEKLFIENISNNTPSYTIFDLQGKRLQTGIYSEEGINISEFEKGIYFLTVTQDKKTETLKFIKN